MKHPISGTPFLTSQEAQAVLQRFASVLQGFDALYGKSFAESCCIGLTVMHSDSEDDADIAFNSHGSTQMAMALIANMMIDAAAVVRKNSGMEPYDALMLVIQDASKMAVDTINAHAEKNAAAEESSPSDDAETPESV